jgi:hypothetical protein
MIINYRLLVRWMSIALMISVLFNLGTIYYAVQVQREITTLKNAQLEREKTAQDRQEDLQNEANGFARMLGGSKQ